MAGARRAADGSVAMSLGIDEGLYPFGKPLVQSSEITHEFTVMRLSLLWIRQDAVGLVQILHLRSCKLGITLELIRMIGWASALNAALTTTGSAVCNKPRTA